MKAHMADKPFEEMTTEELHEALNYCGIFYAHAVCYKYDCETNGWRYDEPLDIDYWNRCIVKISKLLQRNSNPNDPVEEFEW